MTSPTVQRRRRRRLLAIGTAGLALAIGISVTSLAAWQQQINVGTANNGIGSSLLSIQLSLDGGTTWTDATVSSNGSIGFDTDASLLTPGDTVYASVLLRAAVGSRGADVTLGGASIAADVLLGALTYTASAGVTSAQCTTLSHPSVGQVLVATGSALSTGSGGTGFVVPAATANAAGTAVGVCLAVSLPTGVLSSIGGKNATPSWLFSATSR